MITTRRTALGLLIAGALPKPATALVSYNPQNVILNARTTGQDFEVYWSYGQSWRSNAWDSIEEFGFAPGGPLAMLVSSIGAPTFDPGPLSSAAGIALGGPIIGVTQRTGTDQITIGQCAILAQQLWRLHRGLQALPILEFCTAYPGSSWFSGGGGGLAPGAQFTASVVNDVMTVTAVAPGVMTETLVTGQILQATGIAVNSRIVSGGPGGVGVYGMGVTFTALPSQFIGSGIGASVFIGHTGGNPSQIVIVDSISSGTIQVGQTIIGSNLPANTTVRAYGTDGTTGIGGVGTYSLQLGLPQNLSARTFNGLGQSWNNMLTVTQQFNALVPPRRDLFGDTLRLATPMYAAFGYTQGGAADLTEAGKLFDLTSMFQQIDLLGLPGSTGRKGYFGLPAPVTTATIASDTAHGTVVFCKTNAPGAGGPYSERTYFSSCSYPWPFIGVDNIHTGPYGTCRWGEIEGYVKHLVEDMGVAFTPLWQSGTITVAGQQITIPWSRPTGPDFTSAPMEFYFDPDDGLIDWPQKGFHVRRAGVELTVNSLEIIGMGTKLTITQALSAGDVLEVSYAYRGPGGPDPGPHTGVGGNLVMRGPPSVLFPNGLNGITKSTDMWAVSFTATITV